MSSGFERAVKDERGQGLVEYAVILALVAVVCLVGLRLLGSGTRNVYANISTSMNSIGQ